MLSIVPVLFVDFAQQKFSLVLAVSAPPCFNEQMKNINLEIEKHARSGMTLQACSFERPEVTTQITKGVCRFLVGLGYAPLTEYKLANGRRADIAAIDRKGHIIMVEVKSCREDYAVDQKWTDYVGFCDAFYFAVSKQFPVDLLPADQGLILADEYGAFISRDAIDNKLAAARRKAVTLRMTRQALYRQYQAEHR